MSVKVTTNAASSVQVRIGQQNAIKVVSSSLSSSGNLANINDIDASNRENLSILMYNNTTGKYEHVSPFHVVDMSDSVQDSAMDAGTF